MNIEEIKKQIDTDLSSVSRQNELNDIKSNNKYLLELLINNSRNVNLNCLYLIRYGVSDIEKVILTKTEDITKDHDEFIKDIKSLEKELNKKEIIALYENA